MTPLQLSPPEVAAWEGLLRAHAALVRDVDRDLRAAHGLPLAWYDVLCELAAAPAHRMRMGELADRVMLTPAGLSGLVDRLERARLVERRACDGDARGTYAAITAEGLRRREGAHTTHRDTIRRLYTGRLDAAELRLLGRLWERFAGNGTVR